MICSFLAVIVDEASVMCRVMLLRTGRKRLSETYVYTGNGGKFSTSHYIQINIVQVYTLSKPLRHFHIDYLKEKPSAILANYNKNSFIRCQVENPSEIFIIIWSLWYSWNYFFPLLFGNKIMIRISFSCFVWKKTTNHYDYSLTGVFI